MRKILPFFITCLLLISGQIKAEIWYVSPGGSGNGKTSWANASGNLQNVIDAAQSGDEIWVAQGTYIPTIKAGNGTEDRDVSFVLKSGVAIYGGFFGNEATRAARNPTLYLTTLNGDINNTPTDNTDDAYHVVISVANNSDTILDGFTIEKGHANGTTGNITVSSTVVPRNSGGGIMSRSSDAKFANLIIQKNFCYGGNGGGVYSSPGNLTIANTKILQNESSVATGGNGTSGAIWISGASGSINKMTLTDVTISNNTAKNNGGAIYINTYSNITFNNVIFENNTTTAGLGGAIYITGLATAINNVDFSKVVFKGNTATAGSGGAIYMGANSNYVFNDASFIKNEARLSAGALFLLKGATDAALTNPLIRNTIFYGNKAQNTANGGGAAAISGANTNLVNCTFYENYAKFRGGAINVYSGASVAIYNSILFANVADDTGVDIYNTIAAGTLTNIDLKNSLTQVAGTNALNGNVVGANPNFFNLDENHPFFLQLDYTTSPAVNTGLNAHFTDALTSKDRAGYDRIYGGTIDMGAYESNPVVLPVTLDRYEAKLLDGVVKLTWTTLSERHNDYFLIEKSADGKTFETLQKIPAKGNGASTQLYTAQDTKPYSPYTYYQLKQVDLDGTTKNYDVLRVKTPILTSNKVNVYPNPVTANQLNFATANKSFTNAKIVNLYGQVVKEFTINTQNNSSVALDITGLSPNIYFLQLLGNSQKETVKFQKL
ncbi:right-handed parallel beta-helix repeat-containing protein [Pedobacter sp. SL55]|uniref:right-handed parallel beta-helix repeat-containing protein n=1 Tax=Pedobacter sp. SL55 TaxID=2995161 RepID=UPI00226E3AE0|nr:right-handed parallel beta-helix repeat-containing protein [Pedobacter sp. SL55]WAC40383.1 T9SS type A sorting domain-containing protein [Pedobacter sp. SL55]